MSTPIADVLDKIDQSAQTFTFNGYAALAHNLATPIALAITAYIAFIGWATLQSWSPFTVGQVTKHALKISIAYTLATQWDVFSEFIYDVLTNGPNELSAILMQTVGNSSDSVNSALQTSFNDGISMGNQLWNQHSIITKGVALCVWCLDFLVTGVALAELAIAKQGLAIVLVLAPVFSLCLLWRSTKGIFDSWFRFALGFSLVPLFVSSVLLVVDQLMELGIGTVESALQTNTADIVSIATYILSCGVSFALLWKAASIAAGIANGIEISAAEATANTMRMVDQVPGLRGIGNLGTQGMKCAMQQTAQKAMEKYRHISGQSQS